MKRKIIISRISIMLITVVILIAFLCLINTEVLATGNVQQIPNATNNTNTNRNITVIDPNTLTSLPNTGIENIGIIILILTFFICSIYLYTKISYYKKFQK